MKSAMGCALLLLFLSSEGFAQVPPAKEGAISGLVIRASDGAPVANARLEIWRPSGMMGSVPLGFDPLVGVLEEKLAEIVTGDDGRFRLTGVDPAEGAMVRIAASGFRTTLARIGANSCPTIALAAGARISGRVTDPEGRPIPEAGIFAVPSDLKDMGMRAELFIGWFPPGECFPVIETRTDEAGRYTLDGLGHADRYAVRVDAEGFVDTRRDEVVAPGTADFQLPRGVTVTVTVEEAGGGAPGVQVWLHRTDFPRTLESWTDDSGVAVFRGVPSGRARVGAGPVRETVLVPASGDLALKLLLPETPLTWRRETAGGPETIEGRVVRPDGSPPVRRVAVCIPRRGRTVQTEADGSFRIDSLPEGESTLTVTRRDGSLVETRTRAPGPPVRIVLPWANGVRGSLTFPPGRKPELTAFLKTNDRAEYLLLTPSVTDNRRCTFEVGTSPGKKTVTLRPRGYRPVVWTGEVKADESLDLGEFTLDPGRSQTGRVIDENGEPVAEAYLSVDEGRNATTDAEGRFRLEGLEAEELPISVYAEGFVPAVSMTDAGEEELVIQLVREIMVEVRVVVRDAEGNPVPRALVALRQGDNRPDWRTMGHTGSDGAVRLAAAPGTYTLTADGPFAPKVARSLDLDPSHPPEDIVLTAE